MAKAPVPSALLLSRAVDGGAADAARRRRAERRHALARTQGSHRSRARPAPPAPSLSALERIRKGAPREDLHQAPARAGRERPARPASLAGPAQRHQGPSRAQEPDLWALPLPLAHPRKAHAALSRPKRRARPHKSAYAPSGPAPSAAHGAGHALRPRASSKPRRTTQAPAATRRGRPLSVMRDVEVQQGRRHHGALPSLSQRPPGAEGHGPLRPGGSPRTSPGPPGPRQSIAAPCADPPRRAQRRSERTHKSASRPPRPPRGALCARPSQPEGRGKGLIYGAQADLCSASPRGPRVRPRMRAYFYTPASGGVPPLPNAITVNGKVSGELELDAVSRGSTSVIHLVGAHALSVLDVSIDGVALQVFAVDATALARPFLSLRSVAVTPGQRVSVLVNWGELPRFRPAAGAPAGQARLSTPWAELGWSSLIGSRLFGNKGRDRAGTRCRGARLVRRCSTSRVPFCT